MLRRILSSLAAAALLALAAQSAFADQKGDVVALVNDAVEHFKKVGAEQAYKDFADPKGAFLRGEMYIYVMNMTDGRMVAHAVNSKLNGTPQMDMKDMDGTLLTRATFDSAKKGDGWVAYKWVHPTTKKIAGKRSFAKALGDLVFVSGYYE